MPSCHPFYSFRAITGLVSVVWLMSSLGLHAQTNLADPEAYREAKRIATVTFLDRSRSKEERLSAAKNLGYPEDKTLVALLEIGVDQGQDDAIRWEALRRYPFGDTYLDAVLKILNDPADGSETLDASLIEDVSRRIAFAPPPQVLQRIQATFRKLLDDKRDKVRLSAYRSLVGSHDPVAVNLLADSVKKGQGIPVPLAEAIDLLNEDGPVNHIGVLRQYLTNDNPLVQAQAARALAVDPESRPKIVELAKNPRTPLEVRLYALRALAREDSRFADYALPLVEDGRGDPKVRSAAMQAFAGRMNYNSVEPTNQVRFALAVEKLADDNARGTDEVRKMQEAAKQLNLYLRKSFPEIQKFYENR